jgi:hypothetical protein
MQAPLLLEKYGAGIHDPAAGNRAVFEADKKIILNDYIDDIDSAG